MGYKLLHILRIVDSISCHISSQSGELALLMTSQTYCHPLGAQIGSHIMETLCADVVKVKLYFVYMKYSIGPLSMNQNNTQMKTQTF